MRHDDASDMIVGSARSHMLWVIRRALLLARDHWKDEALRKRYIAQARRARDVLRNL